MSKTRQSTMNAIQKYESENIRRINLKLNRKLEPDLVKWVESHDSIQGYITDLIRADMIIKKGRYCDGKNKYSSDQSEQ